MDSADVIKLRTLISWILWAQSNHRDPYKLITLSSSNQRDAMMVEGTEKCDVIKT